MVRALTSHQCGPGSVTGPRRDLWDLGFVVGSYPCSKGFSPGSLVSLSPQKTKTSKFNWESKGNRYFSYKTITFVKQS